MSESSGVVSVCLELVNGTLAIDVLISVSVGARQEGMANPGCNLRYLKFDKINAHFSSYCYIYSSRHDK